MASSGAAPAAGQGGALTDLREQLLALANTENQLRLELKAARAQIAQLAQNEAMARSLLKESHSVTRALHERTRLETDATTAGLRESLEAARAQAERAAAEVEWARERAQAAAESEQEAKAALFEVRKQLAQEQEKIREGADERERAGAHFAGQLAALRKKSEEERALANAEIARRVQAVETLQGALSAASTAAEKVAADLEEEKAVAVTLRDEVGRLESARDRSQEAARDVSLREGRTALELAETQGRATQLESQLDERRRAVAALQQELTEVRTELEKSETGRAALEAGVARLQEELQRASGEARAQQDDLVRKVEDERALLAAAKAEHARLSAEMKVETTRAENALRESQGVIARCDAAERELAEAAQRMRAAETETAQAKAAQERQRAIASARREALIAELDGRFADAEALLQAELGQSQIEAPLLLQLGRLHFAWAEGTPGSHAEIAERLLARAAELDQYDATAPLYLGHVRLRRGLHGAAREAYLETIDRDPQCAPAHEALAVLSIRSTKRQARIAFAAAIALLLCSGALAIHRLVQGTAAPAASALSETQERSTQSEGVSGRRSAER